MICDVEKMTKAAEVLENFEEESKPLGITGFYLSTWLRETGFCGTSACAVGTFMCHPWFNSRGLQKVDTSWGWEPAYQGTMNFQAVELFFGIGEKVSRWLFHPKTYTPKILPGAITARDVAFRARALLKYNEMKLAAHARDAARGATRKERRANEIKARELALR